MWREKLILFFVRLTQRISYESLRAILRISSYTIIVRQEQECGQPHSCSCLKCDKKRRIRIIRFIPSFLFFLWASIPSCQPKRTLCPKWGWPTRQVAYPSIPWLTRSCRSARGSPQPCAAWPPPAPPPPCAPRCPS